MEEDRKIVVTKIGRLLSDQLETPTSLLNEGESHINSYRVYIGGFRTNIVVGYEELMYWDEDKQADLVNTLKGSVSPNGYKIVHKKEFNTGEIINNKE